MAAIAEQEEAQSEVAKDEAPAKKAAKTGILQFLVPTTKHEPQTSPTEAQTAAETAQGGSNGNAKSAAGADAKLEAGPTAKAGAGNCAGKL